MKVPVKLLPPVATKTLRVPSYGTDPDMRRLAALLTQGWSVETEVPTRDGGVVLVLTRRRSLWERLTGKVPASARPAQAEAVYRH